MSTTRRGLCSLAALALTGSVGCLDVFTGDESARFVAPLAPVADETLDGTRYELDSTEAVEKTRTFEVAGQSREVEVVNRISEYHKTIDIGPLGETRGAVFTTLSTPAVEVLGRTFNPIDDMTNRDIAEESQSQYEEISIGREVERQTVEVIGDDVGLSKFEGEATFAGLSVDVYVHVGVAEGEETFVVVFGIYPRLLANEERTIITLAEGVILDG